MKKIILIVAMFLLCAGVVSASSVNGDYNGNPIVIVKSQGKVLESDEVPAMIYDGHTLVPISLLRQIGASVDWDADTYSVNVSLPQTAPAIQSISDISKAMKQNNVLFVQRFSDGGEINTISYRYAYPLNQMIQNDFTAITRNSISVDAITMEIIYSDGAVFSAPIQAFRDWAAQKISSDQLTSQYKLTTPNQNSSSNSSLQTNPNYYGNPSSTNESPSQLPATNPTSPSTTNPKSTQDSNNAAICQQIKEDYVLKMSQFKRNNNPYSGGTEYREQILNSEYQKSLAAFGCK